MRKLRQREAAWLVQRHACGVAGSGCCFLERCSSWRLCLRETHWPLFLCPPWVSGQPVMGHGCVSDCTCGILWKEEFTTYLSGGSDSKECACKVGNLGLIPGSGRSPGGGHGNPLQYSCLENPMDGGAWRAPVHRVAKSQTRLSD